MNLCISARQPRSARKDGNEMFGSSGILVAGGQKPEKSRPDTGGPGRGFFPLSQSARGRLDPKPKWQFQRFFPSRHLFLAAPCAGGCVRVSMARTERVFILLCH